MLYSIIIRPMFPLQHFIRAKYFDQYFTKTIKNRSRRILRLWTDHCEYIIAQRFRRGQQMICLYRRIWDEQLLRGIVHQLRKQVIQMLSFNYAFFDLIFGSNEPEVSVLVPPSLRNVYNM